MDAFGALADPNRRAIIEHLAEAGPSTATDICRLFDITPSAVSQHLKVLAEAEFVCVRREGRCRIYTVNFEELARMQGWITELGMGIKQSFDKLDTLLKEDR